MGENSTEVEGGRANTENIPRCREINKSKFIADAAKCPREIFFAQNSDNQDVFVHFRRQNNKQRRSSILDKEHRSLPDSKLNVFIRKFLYVLLANVFAHFQRSFQSGKSCTSFGSMRFVQVAACVFDIFMIFMSDSVSAALAS